MLLWLLWLVLLWLWCPGERRLKQLFAQSKRGRGPRRQHRANGCGKAFFLRLEYSFWHVNTFNHKRCWQMNRIPDWCQIPLNVISMMRLCLYPIFSRLKTISPGATADELPGQAPWQTRDSNKASNLYLCQARFLPFPIFRIFFCSYFLQILNSHNLG